MGSQSYWGLGMSIFLQDFTLSPLEILRGTVGDPAALQGFLGITNKTSKHLHDQG